MTLPTSYSWVLSTSGGGSSGGAIAGSGFGGNRTTGDGKTGFAIPFAADGRGRLALCSGNQQLEKIITLNLSDLDSENPYQGELGLGAESVFAIASVKLRNDVKRKINLLFRRLQLQDRARLESPPAFTENSADQELTVDIRYINLEEDKPGTLGLLFSLIGSV